MDVARSSVTALDHLHKLGHRVVGHAGILRPRFLIAAMAPIAWASELV
jgi:hypothetical protein